MSQRVPPLLTGALLLPILLLLLGGLLAGLVRMGWPLPFPLPALAGLHGPLMVCGVLGTLIGLERAANARSWGYAAPAFSAAGAIGLILGLPVQVGGWLFVGAAGVQLALIRPRQGRAWTAPLLIQALGLLCWLTGTLLWLWGQSFGTIALWWVGLLLLTIAGGRMAKFLPPGQGRGMLAATGLYVTGLLLALAWPAAGLRLAGLALVLSAGWLMLRDPACRALRAAPAARLMAVCLLCGYGWLGIGGLLLLTGPPALTGLAYDMTLHSLFVGFVFSLVLGHLPQLLPQLLRGGQSAPASPVHHPLLYLPVALLELSLLARLAGGLQADTGLRAWGGLLNVLALLGYALLVLVLKLRGHK